MLSAAITLTVALLVVAIGLAAWRLLRGPHVCDRILALDTLYVNAAGLLIVLGVADGAATLFEAALLVAVLGFVGTVALSKYVESRDLIE
ncbi:MAG: K+/H+ antiporter subunit F [Burkholderiales bacterium]|jgi:multicomponent K+:H+ antiporter subunit F|nr:K+/H+ antiporter subunit F [Burkholderiales bacterium]